METIQAILAQIPWRNRCLGRSMKAERILIVDDTPANVALLSDALEPHGYVDSHRHKVVRRA
jgi:hypothetical protein